MSEIKRFNGYKIEPLPGKKSCKFVTIEKCFKTRVLNVEDVKILRESFNKFSRHFKLNYTSDYFQKIEKSFIIIHFSDTESNTKRKKMEVVFEFNLHCEEGYMNDKKIKELINHIQKEYEFFKLIKQYEI